MHMHIYIPPSLSPSLPPLTPFLSLASCFLGTHSFSVPLCSLFRVSVCARAFAVSLSRERKERAEDVVIEKFLDYSAMYGSMHVM